MTAVRAHQAVHLSIIIPTKDRCASLGELIESIRQSERLADIQPEIIVGDNDSSDDTWRMLERTAGSFPTPFRCIEVRRPGKSAVLNEAIGIAAGDVCALLDDDVVVDPGWLVAMHRYFSDERCPVAQGVVRLPPREAADAEVLRLFRRFQTIPLCEKPRGVETIRSLNGSNMALRRSVFERIGGFDERVGPGMAGTANDTELARRILAAHLEIGYVADAVVFHRVERERLTECYFERHHRRQGCGRFLYKQPGLVRILMGLGKGLVQYGFHTLTGNERKKYRGKGRVYHYRGMLAAKLEPTQGPDAQTPRSMEVR